MPSISVTIEGLDDVLRRLDKGRTVRSGDLLKIAGGAVFTGTRLRFRDGRDPSGTSWPAPRRLISGAGEKSPLIQSGRLRNSITWTSNEFVARVGTNVRYAAIHQFGGTVLAKGGKALAIPLDREAALYKPRDFPRKLELVWPKGRRSGWLVEHKAGRGKRETGAKDIFKYLLVRQVTIKKRPFLGVSQADRDEIRHRLIEFLDSQTGGK